MNTCSQVSITHRQCLRQRISALLKRFINITANTLARSLTTAPQEKTCGERSEPCAEKDPGSV